MADVIGWVAWGFVAFLALSFAYSCRKAAAAGQAVMGPVRLQSLFWWIIAILFLVAPLNKLHLIWLVPALFFLSQVVVFVRIPVVSVVAELATVAFMRLLLSGTAPASAGPTKADLIRSLIRERLEIAGLLLPEYEEQIAKTKGLTLMGAPEAGIVTNVETYVNLKREGMDDQAIFARIEDHRAKFGGRGTLPSPLTLETYVRYRVDLEVAPTAAPLTDAFVRLAIEKSLQYFGYAGHDGGRA